MSEKPRDWDKELAEIDKVIARGPAPTPAPAPATRPAAALPASAPPPAAPVRRRDRAGSWVRSLLAVALAVALPFWPYAAACGFDLVLYAGAVALLVLVSLWAATATWRRQQGFAHVLSLLALLWGVMLAGTIVLPRIGYARAPLTWMCG